AGGQRRARHHLGGRQARRRGRGAGGGNRGGAVKRVALALALAALAGGCLMPRYLSQAARGQLDLMERARPIEDVIADPSEPIETRLRLAEVAGIKAYGAAAGLNTRRNYNKFVDVPDGAAVWFVGASKPLAFEPRS